MKTLSTYARSEYSRLRRLGWTASNAMRAARVRDLFHELDQDLVKLEVEPEIDCYDDSYLDDNSMRPSDRDRYRKDLHKRLNRDGHWILVSYWRPDVDSDWEVADSIGGFVGDDYKDSCYDDDLRDAALTALQTYNEHLAEKQAEELASRATYAGVPLC